MSLSSHMALHHGGPSIQLTSAPCRDFGAHQHSQDDHTLYVITPINNFCRFKRRYELFHRFKEHIESFPNVKLYIVEAALGDRPFMVTEPDNPQHLQVRTEDELWIKENTINLMVSRLPHNWKYMAWIDADITFLNQDWANETVHMLQHYHVVQMWENAVNMGPDGEAIGTVTSFMSQYIKGKVFPYDKKAKYADGAWHPGFAWACTRHAFEGMGGLIDFAILGAGDHHMALALIGKYEYAIPKTLNKHYKKMLKQYQKRCERTIRRDVGYIKGTIIHGWHGRFKNRKYHDRWQILVENNYDPRKDIKKNSHGVLVFGKNNIGLRDGIRGYFRQRNEDGIEND